MYEKPAVRKIEMDALVKHMVNRFLRWRLPENFNPDGGIRYIPFPPNGAGGRGPTGTNLFTAEQAEVMVRYMLFGGTDE